MSLSLSLGLSLTNRLGGDEDMALSSMMFGDGIDDDVIVSGAVSLTRDMYYRNLTIVPGGSIRTNGKRIWVSELLTLSTAPTDAIRFNVVDGGDATGVGAGAAPTETAGTDSSPWSPVRFAGVGKAGGTAAGTAGTNGLTVNTLLLGGRAGVTGGVGGNGSSGSGGAAGTASTTVMTFELRFPTLWAPSTTPVMTGGESAPSGGSGAGDGTAGGGSGSGGFGGGSIFIAAKRILRSSSNANAGIIAAKGGRGGNGGIPAGGNRGGGGGSPGSGGGNVYIMTMSLEGSAHTNAIDVSGGGGGGGGAGTGTGTAGQGAQAGFGGVVQVINLGTSAMTITSKRAIGGTAASGATGGAATTAQCDL